MKITKEKTAQLLLEADNILILTHRRPDGDTLGSGFGLLFALEALGKTARVECPDTIPAKYDYLFAEGAYEPKSFTPRFIVAVDTADHKLLGALGENLVDQIDLVIDHHSSNTLYGKHTLLGTHPAAAELLYEVITELGVSITPNIASALYTGIATDTGCFRYPSVTAKTHEVAARLIQAGADHVSINRLMFETNSKGRLQAESQIIQDIEYHHNDRTALILIPAGMQEKYGVDNEDLDGIAAVPRTVEGVYAGVTLRDNADETYRVSLRSLDPIDSSRICASHGGGGHKNAAGGLVKGTLAQAKQAILATVAEELERNGL